MCSRAKTFCPCCNFASAAARGCVLHSSAMRDQRAGPAGGGGPLAVGEAGADLKLDPSDQRRTHESNDKGEEDDEPVVTDGRVDLTDLLGGDDESWGMLLGPLTAQGIANGCGSAATPQGQPSPPAAAPAGESSLFGAAQGTSPVEVRPPQRQCVGLGTKDEAGGDASAPQPAAEQQQVVAVNATPNGGDDGPTSTDIPSAGKPPPAPVNVGAPALDSDAKLQRPAVATTTPPVTTAPPPAASGAGAGTGASGTLATAVLQQEQREQLATQSTQLQKEMAELVSLLPPHYVISTVLQDRLVHLQLFKRLRSSMHARVVSHWAHHTDRAGKQALRLHLLFIDGPGSLAAVAGALSKAGVNILEAAVFCTATGFALDIFTLSAPTANAAVHADQCISEVRARSISQSPQPIFISPAACPCLHAGLCADGHIGDIHRLTDT